MPRSQGSRRKAPLAYQTTMPLIVTVAAARTETMAAASSIGTWAASSPIVRGTRTR
jgi:hypothetical protein